jgi:hypothetical protein
MRHLPETDLNEAPFQQVAFREGEDVGDGCNDPRGEHT